MPLKSEAERRWMWATHPGMAKRWEKETPKRPLPERAQHKADGGIVSEESKVQETDTHFHVGSFRISKKGLNKPTAESIRQYLACGGKVQKPKQHLAGGEFVLPEAPVRPEPTTARPVIPPADLVPQTPDANQVASGEWAPGGPMAVPAPAPGPSLIPGLGDAPALASRALGALGIPGAGETPPPPVVQPDTSAPPMLAAPGNPNYPGAYQPPPQARPQPQIESPGQVYDRMTGQFAEPDRMMRSAERLGERGIQERATAAKPLYDAIAATNQAAADAGRNMLKDVQGLQQKISAQADQMQSLIANSRIDPAHFWSEESGHSKVRAAIGLIISGMGAGLTGQPNLAMDVINKGIERDIDAQKFNLNKTMTMYSYNLQRLKDEVAARQVTHGMMLQAAAGELEANKAKLAGAVLAPEAEIAIANLRMQGAQYIQAGMSARAQLAMNKLAFERSAMEMQAIRRMVEAGDGSVPSEVIPYLSKETRDQIVQIPYRQLVQGTPEGKPPQYVIGSKPKMVINSDMAKGTPEKIFAANQLGHVLQDYDNFLARHPAGVVIPDAAKAEAASLKERLVAAAAHVVFKENDKLYTNITKGLDTAIKNPGSWTAALLGQQHGSMRDLWKAWNEHVASVVNTYVVGGSRGVPGMPQPQYP